MNSGIDNPGCIWTRFVAMTSLLGCHGLDYPETLDDFLTQLSFEPNQVPFSSRNEST
ncbi:hypothetical protein SALB1_0027 [Salinisphaera sp. LB1]|nr:hypothetical protein SALB1_0027 [Salinisphaera sp. LB1]